MLYNEYEDDAVHTSFTVRHGDAENGPWPGWKIFLWELEFAAKKAIRIEEAHREAEEHAAWLDSLGPEPDRLALLLG